MSQRSEIIGMPVVKSDTGDEIGHVKEVIVHRVKKSVFGFLVRNTGLFQYVRVIPFSKVESIDDSGVAVPDGSCLVGLSEVPEASRLLSRKRLDESKLISTDGHEIGRICDFYFDDQSGELTGFDVATGDSPDSLSEPQFLPLDDKMVVGRDDVIVSGPAIFRVGEEVGKVNRAQKVPEKVEVKQPLPASTVPASSRLTEEFTVIPQVEKRAPVNHDQLKVTRSGTSLTIGFDTIDVPDDLSIAGYWGQISRLLAETPNCTNLIFDVGNIKILPSSLLGLLVSLRKKVEHLEIHNPSRDGREALRILGFDKYMTIRGD